MIPWVWVPEPQVFADLRQSSFDKSAWQVFGYALAVLVIVWQLLVTPEESA